MALEASAVHVYVKHRLNTIAILRCLGGSAEQVFAVYLLQTLVLGLVGAAMGASIGMVIQTVLPAVLHDFLPVRMNFQFAWGAVLQGLSVGFGMTVLFALMLLLAVRRVSPLRLLRTETAGPVSGRQDLALWFVVACIVLGSSVFALLHTAPWMQGLVFVAALVLVCGFLAGVAQLIMVGVRHYFPNSWTYVWRQELANLYRPNNQTRVLILVLGLGSTLIVVLHFSQHTPLSQVALAGSANQPNVLLFDIQTDQQEDVAELVRSFDMPVMEMTPIVNMRLTHVKGRRDS